MLAIVVANRIRTHARANQRRLWNEVAAIFERSFLSASRQNLTL